jgi:hypothetical protein
LFTRGDTNGDRAFKHRIAELRLSICFKKSSVGAVIPSSPDEQQLFVEIDEG